MEAARSHPVDPRENGAHLALPPQKGTKGENPDARGPSGRPNHLNDFMWTRCDGVMPHSTSIAQLGGDVTDFHRKLHCFHMLSPLTDFFQLKQNHSNSTKTRLWWAFCPQTQHMGCVGL